jgi:hypothetical protein
MEEAVTYPAVHFLLEPGPFRYVHRHVTQDGGKSTSKHETNFHWVPVYNLAHSFLASLDPRMMSICSHVEWLTHGRICAHTSLNH